MSPVTDPMMEVFAHGEPCQRHLRVLLAARLLFFVSADPQSDDAPSGYAVHPMVRSFLLHHAATDDPGSVPNFALPGFTSGGTPVYPGLPQNVTQVTEMFDAMRSAAEG